MIDDVFKSYWIVGMVQLKFVEDEVLNKFDLFGIGCVGCIILFSEIGDGCYFIILFGVCWFFIKDELDCVMFYCQIMSDFFVYEVDLYLLENISDVNWEKFLVVFKIYMQIYNMEIDWDFVK